MTRNLKITSEPTANSPEALFSSLSCAIAQDPQFTHVFLPGKARPLCDHYGISHLQNLINKVPKVHEYWESNGVEHNAEVSKADVIDHVLRGRTLICNSMHLADAQSALWASRLVQMLGRSGKSAARIFYTNAVEQAYGMHLDPFYTLTLQIFGSKLWRLGRRPEVIDTTLLNHSVMAPAPGVVEQGPYGQIQGPENSADLFEEVLLQPGDALLIAPGVWHHVIPVSESFSVALDVVPESQSESPLEIALIRHTE